MRISVNFTTWKEYQLAVILMSCFMTVQVAQAQLPAGSRLFNEGWSFH